MAATTPEQQPAEAPRVSYQDGQLIIHSKNSTLHDILKAVAAQIGAQIDPPPSGADERVAADLAGAPASVLSKLLQGIGFGYIILSPPDDPLAVEKVIFLGSNAPSADSAAVSTPKPSPLADGDEETRPFDPAAWIPGGPGRPIPKKYRDQQPAPPPGTPPEP